MNNTLPLLKEYGLSGLKLKNRLVMTPITRKRKQLKAGLMAEDYAQRTKTGLILSEGSPISEKAVGYINAL